jgi:hypothetical protein
MNEEACGRPRCAIEWLLDPAGPDDPAWIARVRAEIDNAPSLVGRNGDTRFAPTWGAEEHIA